MIVVIAILAILAAILIPALTNYIEKATKSKNQANCRSAYTKYALDVATATSASSIPDPVVPGADMTFTNGSGAVLTFVCDFDTYSFSLLGNFEEE